MRVCKNTNDDLRMDGSRISREQTSERERERARKNTEDVDKKKPRNSMYVKYTQRKRRRRRRKKNDDADVKEVRKKSKMNADMSATNTWATTFFSSSSRLLSIEYKLLLLSAIKKNEERK